MRNISILLLLVIFMMSHQAMGQKFGIRAGLNYSSFSGPLESGVSEKNKFTNGFHFGFTYAYPIYEDLAVRAELMYAQFGSRLEYEGESFYRIRTVDATINERGNSIIDLKITNTYLGLPIVLQYTFAKKFEVSLGAYVQFLIQTRGAGQHRFISYDHPAEIFMKQSLDHNYKKDVAGGGTLTGPAVIVDGKVVFLYKNTGAYYQMFDAEKSGTLYNSIDYGLTGGLSYFITKGFYAGLRYDYGLADITNNRMDPSRKALDENGELIYTNDFDRNVVFNISMGFRF